MIRRYSELCKLKTFDDRFNYLAVKGTVASETFGYDRYLNQQFYTSTEWQRIRNYVIDRDNGCDLGLENYEIGGRIVIHHMNPIVVDDIIHSSDILLDPEYLVCTSFDTHNAIHFGKLSDVKIVERSKNDTCPWKH